MVVTMASVGRVTHAVVARVPSSFMTAATVDGTCIDLERAREQQEALVKCLRGLDIDVLEMAPEESSPCSVFTRDLAVTLHGTALICRPAGQQRQQDAAAIRAVLKKEVGLMVVEPESAAARLAGSDVLFTGREFFVGVGGATNMEGALAVAATWPEFPCTPVKVEGSRALGEHVSLAGPGLLSVGLGQHSRNLVRRLEREATVSYQTLTLPEEDAANCLYVNNTLIHTHHTEAPLSAKVFGEKLDFATKEVSMSEFQKTGRGLSSLCIMINKRKTIRRI